MSQIYIETIYLSHEGGTKFYEVCTFWNPTAKIGAVVRRWGKNSVSRGGGEVKMEWLADTRAIQSAKSKIVSAKGGRGYREQSIRFGFHDTKDSLTNAEFGDAAIRHYGSEIGSDIALKLTGVAAEVSGEIDPDDIVVLEPEPEVDRGGDWGSW